MCDETLPANPPSASPSVPASAPNAASARPGPTAPPIGGGSLQPGADDPGFDDLGALLAGVGELFAISRAPRADALWARYRPRLLLWEQRLLAILATRPDDAVVAGLASEIRQYLGHHGAPSPRSAGP